MLSLNKNAFVIVIVFLGVALLSCIAGFIGLAAQGTAVPDELKMIATGALTGLGGLLAKTPDQPPPGD